MNESSIIRILSGQNYNIFENDQYYTLNLSSNEYSFLQSINPNIWDIHMKSDKYRESILVDFGDIELHARYIGKSRIDNSPLFAINLKAEIRKQIIKNLIE